MDLKKDIYLISVKVGTKKTFLSLSNIQNSQLLGQYSKYAINSWTQRYKSSNNNNGSDVAEKHTCSHLILIGQDSSNHLEKQYMLFAWLIKKTVNRHKKNRRHSEEGKCITDEREEQVVPRCRGCTVHIRALSYVTNFRMVWRWMDGWMMNEWMVGTIESWLDGTPGQPLGGWLRRATSC